MEIVNLRVTASANFEPPSIPEIENGEFDASQAVLGKKAVWFNDSPEITKLYSRPLLKSGNILNGPGVIYQYDTTTVIPPGWQAVVEKHGQLLIEHSH